MVQAVTYQSDKQSVYFQGKLIVLENLTPVLSEPREYEAAEYWRYELGAELD